MDRLSALYSDTFWSHVQGGDGCWLWDGVKTKLGYGAFTIRRQQRLAHRLMFEAINGAIPAGMCVCHVCDVRNCVRPDHLFLGTQAVNMRDMTRKGRNLGALAGGAKVRKLSDEQVRQIRKAPASRQHLELAREYGIDASSLRRIRTGVTYKDVQPR